MTSVVAICNRALIFLGAEPIISLDADIKTSRLCKALYEPARDAVLYAYPWNSAMKREVLAALVDAPAWGYAKQYELPADCLRLYQIDGEILNNTSPYRVEGRKVLTDNGAPLNILYVSKETDTTLYSPLLAESIAAKLAVDLAANLTENANRIVAAQNWFKMVSDSASFTDAQEGTPDEFNADIWLVSRN